MLTNIRRFVSGVQNGNVVLCFPRLRRFLTSSHAKRIPRSYRFILRLYHFIDCARTRSGGFAGSETPPLQAQTCWKRVKLMILFHEVHISNDFRRTNMATDNFPVSKLYDASLPWVTSKFFPASCKTYICYRFLRAQRCDPPPANQVFAIEKSFGRLCAR